MVFELGGSSYAGGFATTSRWRDPMLRKIIIAILAIVSIASVDANTRAQALTPNAHSSVVRVLSIRRSHNLATPWERNAPVGVAGAGALISPTQVLTNYRFVAASTKIAIQLGDDASQLTGQVTGSAPGLDLAIVTLDKPINSIKPIEIAEDLPTAALPVEIHGYSGNSKQAVVSRGTIARLEYVAYKYRAAGLRLQIQASTTANNTSGPVIADGKLVALGLNDLTTQSKVALAIPAVEIKTLLADLEDGEYHGKPRMWNHFQTLESPAMRMWLKMPEDATGIKYGSSQIPSANSPLKPNDVLTHVGRYPINNMGIAKISDTLQLSYDYVVEKEAVAPKGQGTVDVKVLRDGKPLDLKVPVTSDPHFLIAYGLDNPPTYFVHGPLVFGVAVTEYLDSLDAFMRQGGKTTVAILQLTRLMESRENPYIVRRRERVSEPGQQLVVITQLLKHETTKGMAIALPSVVRSINGNQVQNIRHAAELIGSIEDDQLVIELDDVVNTTLVFDHDVLKDAQADILKSNGINAPVSENLADLFSK